MRQDPPTLTIREWSHTTPADSPLLQDVKLSNADREFLDGLARCTSLRVEELRQGLAIEVGSHIGAVTLSGLRIVIQPKLRLDRLMALIAYAFDLAELKLGPMGDGYAASKGGFADMLGLSLLQTVKHIARRGLLPQYQYRAEELGSPRGRIDLRHTATKPPSTRLRCHFAELTTDHLVHQVLAAGLRLAASQVQSSELSLDLAKTADRIFAGERRLRLTEQLLVEAKSTLDRRYRYYGTALMLIALFCQGSHLGSPDSDRGLPLAGFLVDMNRVFERFLSRYLHRHAPRGMDVISQDVRGDVYSYEENPLGWKSPRIRPDLVFRHAGRTVALGDAKYRNHREQPPSAAELYQLTTYALAYPMSEPREVYLFCPAEAGQQPSGARLLFLPSGSARVRIHVVSVPIDSLLSQACHGWWPPGLLVPGNAKAPPGGALLS
jgi:5-methylcytosine-specific restriction enzyme subunit McrC